MSQGYFWSEEQRTVSILGTPNGRAPGLLLLFQPALRFRHGIQHGVTDVTAKTFTERLKEETLTEYEARTINQPQCISHMSGDSLQQQTPLLHAAVAFVSDSVAGYPV
jgi:hypothetical protein